MGNLINRFKNIDVDQKTVLIFIIFQALFCLLPVNIVLKDKFYKEADKLTLQDIAQNDLPDDVGGIIIPLSTDGNCKVTDAYLLSIKEIADIKNITISGSFVIVENGAQAESEDFSESNPYGLNSLVGKIRRYLAGFVPGGSRLDLMILNPSVLERLNGIPLEEIVINYPKIEKGLSDLANLHLIKIKHHGVSHDLEISVNLFNKVYFTKEKKSKDEIISKDDLESKIVDITVFTDVDLIVAGDFDPDGYKVVKDITPGEILRWDTLKKMPVIKSGQRIRLYFSKGNFTLTREGVALEDGYPDSKIKIKIENGKTLYGVVKKIDGEYLIELL